MQSDYGDAVIVHVQSDGVAARCCSVHTKRHYMYLGHFTCRRHSASRGNDVGGNNGTLTRFSPNEFGELKAVSAVTRQRARRAVIRRLDPSTVSTVLR